MVMGSFAEGIARAKYFWAEQSEENWEAVSRRVVPTVLRARPVKGPFEEVEYLTRAMIARKFMPGGRYCYATGRPYHQTQNCVLMRAHDSREGWSEQLYKGSMSLMTGAGVGVAYGPVRHEGAPIKGTGGFATGPIALMQMFNECGRGIMQGGSRRAAIWAGLPWWHGDIHKFIRIKDWSPEVRKLKEEDFSFPATLDHTNISVQLDDSFFRAYNDQNHANHALANSVYWATVEQMLKTAEPGFSVDVGENAGEDLRNAPVAGDTWVLTNDGYRQVSEMVGVERTVWTGKRWATTVFHRTKCDTPTITVQMTGGRSVTCDPDHEFRVRCYKGKGLRRSCQICNVPAKDLRVGDNLDVSLPKANPVNLNRSSWTYGFWVGDGSAKEVTFCNDKKVLRHLAVGVRHESETSRGDIRCYLEPHDYDKNDYNPQCVQSFLAGWFDADGSTSGGRIRLSGEISRLVKARRMLEACGIQSTISKPVPSGYGGVQDTRNLIVLASSNGHFARVVPCQRLDLTPFIDYKSYRTSEIKVLSVGDGPVQDVFCCDVGYEEHTFLADGILVRNCTEVTSRDTDDVCNLASINLGNVETLEEFRELVRLGVMFLLAGTLYSDIPHHAIDVVRAKNRRLGLGLMGIHEWLLKRGKTYGPDDELAEWLSVFRDESRRAADHYAELWRISSPVKVRAIAPTGTIGIVAETTTGIEPVFCVAYKRRYLKDGKVWVYQYVIDPVAKRLISEGVKPEAIEDAYSLAQNVERRVEFQAFVQDYVDHGISSTINLPHWGSELNNANLVRPFGEMLMKYLPRLRGVTVYPDGARGGQPLTPVKYKTAIKHEGAELVEESVNLCDITGKGNCGD